MTALECAFALLKCSPIGNPENSSEYGRAAYILSEHCQGEEDVSEAAMRIFAERIAELERERNEARERERVAILAFDEERQRALREGERVLEARRERDEARKFYNDLTDKYLEATGHLQRERNELLKAMREILKVSEPTPVLTYQKMEDIASKALKDTAK